MGRARSHTRLLSGLAFALLALVAELGGLSMTRHLDFGRHVPEPSYSGSGYYPMLLAVVKFSIALLLARLAWRLARARSSERVAEGVLGRRVARPRMRLTLSPRLWLAFFLLTALIYLVQGHVERAAHGRWPLLGPWLHSSALPVFAVLAVVCAVLWAAVQRWLAEYEEHAERAVAYALRLALRPARVAWPRIVLLAPPRRLFGLAFESRPPPAPA
jgi:hypothetical protein